MSVQTDAAETHFAQRYERVLLNPAAPVLGLGVAHDLARVADSLQIAGDDFGYPGGTDPIGVLIGVPAARGSGSLLTRRWREMDSNFQYASTVRWREPPDLPCLPP